MGLQLPSCAIMFYQWGCIVLLVRNGQERSNLSKSLHCQTCCNKKKSNFFQIWVTEKMKDEFSELQDKRLLCEPGSTRFCFVFFGPPAACYFGIIKESLPRYHSQPHRPCFYLREVASQNWDLELLNGAVCFLPCVYRKCTFLQQEAPASKKRASSQIRTPGCRDPWREYRVSVCITVVEMVR